MNEKSRNLRSMRLAGRRPQGFTLIELMIVVAVVGILSAIAYPSYQEFVRKARRADGKEALVRVQIEQEKWRTNNATYTGTIGDLGLTADSAEGHYEIAITANSATDFTATATGEGSQADDGDCSTLTITSTARTPTACW